MFIVNGTNITLSRGDTGAMRIHADAKRKDTGADFTFGENDRAVFTIKGNGQVMKEKAYQMTDNTFTVVFFNHDTDQFSPGSYSWDVRYVINPYYEQGRDIPIDGDQVLTPNNPMSMNLLTVVGDI